jgi:hypothetical protein
MLYGPINFRSTVVKPYYIKKEQIRLVKELVNKSVNKPVNKPVNVQCRGRLLGLHNKPKPEAIRQSAR